MSGPPNWNPRLQTSSVRFPRKAVETPQIPPNTTARPRPGAPFQPVYPNPITQIPAITAEVTGCGKILDSLYVVNSGTGEAVPYNVTRQTMRGVPTPTVITIATSERYIVFGIDFPYRMSGTDHFVFTFTNQNTNEVTIKNYQPAAQYLVSGLEPGILYTLTVSPYVNGITYPASPPTNPFAISAISEKNVELQGVTLSGGDRSAYISFTGAIPGPPIALAVSNIAIDDNFINYQLRCNLGPSPPRPVNTGTVFVGNLTNGSSYTFTVTPYGETDGIFEYGRPTTLPPYIPGPPSDLFINSITANTTTAFLNTTYDTLVHPIPVSNIVSIWESTFTTLCSLVSQPVTAVRDLSQSYAGFTTLSSLFTPADITYLKSTVSADPGIIQVDITDNTGLWYSFPLANVSGGGIGYVFENSNFTKTQSLYATASSSYTLLFRYVNLGTQICSQIYSPPQTAFTYNGILSKRNHTFRAQNFANGLPSLRTAYATVAVGEPLFPTNIRGISGSHIVSISFTGYDPTLAIPGPKPTFFRYSDNYGNTYTTINSNIVINGLTDTSLYTFTIAGFGNGVYGNTAQYSITPGVRPPSSLSVLAVSNYDVTLSFSPALGGADFYAVVTQNGLAQSASAFPYKIQGLSADVSYYFGAVSFAYTSPVYSILSSVSANLIQEVSSSYAQFLISPSGFPYASGIQQGRTEFVPYLYTISANGQAPAPATVDVTNYRPGNIFPVGTALYVTTNISTLALVQSGVSAGIAYTVKTSGVSYTLTSIGVSGGYYVLNGGPSTLISLSGQQLSLSVTPISNTFTFPITSVTSIYDANGNITAYNVQNPSILKSTTTFSGATVYGTTISAVIPFFSGMTPATFTGTVSSSTFTPTPQNPTFVGPPSNVIITSSAYASQEVRFELAVSGRVNPSLYSYAEVSGKILPGTSESPSIAIRGLTNGSSYTFSISAFGNQVYSPSATRSTRFDLCTNAPQNVVASFFNVTPNISYARSTPSADTYVAELYNGIILKQTIRQVTAGSFDFPNPVNAGNTYNFRVYGILNGISSTACNITAVIAGPPPRPTSLSTVLTSGQIVFNWSSEGVNYSERFRITEYLSNNGVFPTGGQWSNISGLTYTVSAVVTASGTQAFAPTNWIEVSPGYASFVLSNDSYLFLSTISNTYLSNQIYLTLQQSGGVSYTFPLTNITTYNALSNIYTNPNYPKETTDIFNPALSLSVTYSYGTGPFNYGKYFYTLDSLANQVYGPSAGIAAQMFVQPVNGIPTVSVTGTTATVSFAQTAITGSVYRVTNNYGSNVSAAPYAFTNLTTGRPYTFSVVVSNGAFVSISSASSIPIYVGPPSAPLVSTSYYGTTSTVYVTDTTLSLASVFFDSGKQGTGTNIATPSHTNVIQQTSGGFWVGNATGLNGNIKDTLTGFISALADGAGTIAYSNDGIANAMYQFTVTPSTGTMAVSLSSYRLFISGTSLVVSNGSTQVYSGTITTSSYPIQFVSRSFAFGIQSGLSSFFYTSVPASSDLLTISLGGAASFSDYRVYSLNNVGVPATSYTISDQLNTAYIPSLAYTVYSLSGITYASNLFNVTQNVDLSMTARPFGNGVVGPAGTALLYINTPPPQVPFIASLVDTSATVTVVEVSPPPDLPIDSYSLIQYSNGIPTSTQTQPSVSSIYPPNTLPGLRLWLDASDPNATGVVAPGGTAITSWKDKSGLGCNATAGVGDWSRTTAPTAREWQYVASSSDGTKLAAVAAGTAGGIWINASSGAGDWTQQTGGGLPADVAWRSIASDSDGIKLAAVNTQGGIWTNASSGAGVWTRQTGGGLPPSAVWQSIASSSDGTKLAAAAAYSGGIWTNTSSGAGDWTRRTANLPAYTFWTCMASSSDGTKLAVVNIDGGIWTNSNSGAGDWTQRIGNNLPPAAFWYSIASSSDGTKLAAAGPAGIYTNASSGAGAWTQQTNGLPPSANWQSIASSSDGTKLAAVVFGGGIYTNSNLVAGTWTQQTGAPINASWLSIASSSDGMKLTALGTEANTGGIYLSPTFPTINSTGLNGRPTMNFGGSSWFTGSTANTGTTLTCFAVASTTASLPKSGNDQRLVSFASAGQPDWNNISGAIGLFNQAGTRTITTWRNGALISSAPITSNTPFVAVSVYNGISGSIWKNGTVGSPDSTASTGTFAISIYGIGNQAVPTNETWNGYISEVLIYNTALTTAQRQNIESYLSNKWGFTSLTSYTFRYPSLTNNAKYYFRAYTTRLGVSSSLTDPSFPTVEAGRPYPLSGLTASLLNPDATRGNYTLSATLKVGANSNGTMTVSVSGNSQVVSKTVTITTSADQEYSFTVSGGAVYTLSSLAVLNSVQVEGPTTTISAFPFRPQGASLTISTANLGSTYGGIINVTNPSPTTGVTYYYAHSSNNGATVTTPLSTTNTFTALYGSASNYIGYVYSCNVALGLLSTASAVTTTCNVFLSAPTSAVATYNGTNITVNWSANAVSSRYTVRETSGKLDTSTNINTETIRFTGTTGSSYTFEVAAQSFFSPDPSLIYSAFTPTTTISLTTLSAAPVTIDYNGNTITLSWANRGLGYVYTVSQMIGPSLGNINQPNPGQNTITIETVSTFKTYQFAISTSLNGISGGISFSPSITLSTAALNNVSQSYNGNSTGSVSYTISWNSYTPTTDSTIPNYIVREISGKTFEVSGFSRTSFTTANTSAAFTLARTVSSYTFQVNASYKGISGPITTLSAIYMYVNAPPTPPTTTYSNSNITVSWSAAVQPDENSRPDTYIVYDTIGGTLSSVVPGTNNSVNLTATVGLSYQFTVTSIYKGITSPTGLCGDIIRVFTPPPTNVVVTNSGSNLLVSWTGSANSPNATYSISQTLGPLVIPSGFNNVGTSITYTSPSAVTTLSDKILYNFTVVALSNGLSSALAFGTSNFVYTYPVTNVNIYYSNTQLFASWTPNIRQPNAIFNVTAYLESTSSSVGSSYTEPGVTSILIGSGVSNSSYYAKVYALNNNLRQSIPPETTSTSVVRLFTAPPIFNGIGFNGNYAITVNMSSGPQATDDRLRNADTYTLTETANLFFPNASSWTFRPTEVYTIPTLGTQGLTYNFSLYATLCGLASGVASPSGTIQLRLITNAVPANSVVADYFGTTVTISWGKAAQNNVGDANSAPNGGYTIYVSSQGFPVTSLYNDTSIKFIGEAGESYQFSIAAVNNNVGSSLTTGASALVTLYKPVVQFLNVTNSGNVTASGVYYAKMILTWLPDSISTSEVTYTGTAFNRGTGRLEATGSTSSNTLMFDGSLNATYDLTVTARYKGINGNSSTVQISNARPILTVEPLINIGNIVTANYSANEAFSSFDVSIRPTNSGQVLCNIVTTSAFASWRVATSTGGFGYSVSTTAFFNGIPSTTITRTISLIEPAAPSSITFRYNNALVSVSWSSVTANASSYTFTAYDLSADPPILASSQPGLFATSTSFLGILGHTYNVSAFALSSNNITSRGTGTTASIEIPPAPSGSLILSNTGTRVSVSWTISAGYGYSFYVSNEAQRGTIIYSNMFALPGDTFTGVIGQTYSVSLFQISPSNVTSVGSIANTWKVYQPSIPFVSFTNIGRDNTVTWPQDVEGSNCVFRLTDNYLYSNILFPDPANYTGPANGWAVGDVSGWFSPKDLPGCTLWLDASDPSNTGSPVANGTTITTWKDKSGLGCDASGAIGTDWNRQTGGLPTSAPWYSIASSSDGTKLAAVVNGGGIWTNANSGAGTWTKQTSGLPTSANWQSIASSSDGTKLAAVVYTGGIWTNANSGTGTWTRQTGGGLPTSELWFSIASSSDGTKLAAVVNGGGIWTNANSGTGTWTLTSAQTAGWYSIASSSDGTKLAAVEPGGGIWTNATSGAGTWTKQTSGLPTSAGWQSIASSSDGTKLAAVAYNGGIYTNATSGAGAWTKQTSGLPTSAGWMTIASSSDGTKLAAAVYGGGIWTNANSGTGTWTQQTSGLPTSANWQSIASSSDGTKLAALEYGGSAIYVYPAKTLPTIISNGLNNRPTMNFNGTSWFTGLTTNTGLSATVFMVMQQPAQTSTINSTYTRVLSMAPLGGRDDDGITGLLVEFVGGEVYGFRNPDVTRFAQPVNTPYIMDYRIDGTNGISYLNGTPTPSVVSTGNFNIGRYRIGGIVQYNGTPQYTGYISEVLIYSNALTSVQRAQVENYLSQKWAITVTSTALTHAPPLNACNITANYTQVGSYISYTVTTPADDTGATNGGRPYIYSVVPSWNGTNGNTVSTDTESPIRLYKPTTPGNVVATGQGNSFTLNWQSAVIWTSPASTIIPTYLLQVGPTTESASYPTQSFNVIGNTQTVNGFDSSAGTLTISLAAVTPLGYTNPIYGNPAVLTYTVPSGTSVSITQSPTNAETLIVTVPVRSVGAQRTWFFITGTGQGGARTAVVSNFQTYNTNSSNYNVTVSLGYNYTISAGLTSSTTSPPTPADPSAPANPNPFPAKTLNVSGITVTHDACTVTLAWSAVAGAERYYVRTNNNGQPASGKFGQEYPSTTRTVQINNNGASEQFAANATYSYIVQAYTLSSNSFQGSSVGSCNILSDIAVSPNVQMYIPTNPTVEGLFLTQSFSNIIASWRLLESYPKDNSADIGTPSYTISCQTFPSVTTTGTTATFVGINPGASYQLSLNTKYNGFWGATPTTTTFVTTSARIISGPTLTNTGEGQIRVTASAATVGFWYLISGNTETLMNSSTTVPSNQITSDFTAQKATAYTRSVKFVTQDTGLSVTAGTNTVTTPSLVVGASTPVVAAGDRAFSITLSCASGTPVGSVSWIVGTPTGTTFLSGSTSISATTLTYRFTNAAWSTNLSATFTSIILSNNGFTFPYIAPGTTTTQYTSPTNTILTVQGGTTGSTITVTVIGGGGGGAAIVGTGGQGSGGDGGRATYTFANVSLGTPITYYVGSGGGAGLFGGGGGGGSNSYVTIGTTTIYAGGGGGGGSGSGSGYDGNGLGGGVGGRTGSGSITIGSPGSISPIASPASRIEFYGNAGAANEVATRGIVVITQTSPPTYTPPNLNIPTPTLANSAGNLVLSASTTGGCNVNWFWPTYGGVTGTATTPSSTLTVTYGNLGNTGTTYSAGAALSLSFGGYTNSVAQTSLPSFTAPTFSIGTVTFEPLSSLNNELNVSGGATSSTITVTVIGGGGGGSSYNGGSGGNGAVATYTFTGVAIGATITYFVGNGGGGGNGSGKYTGGGYNSYVIIGGTTIYAGGGAGAAFGGNGVGFGGGSTGNVGGGNGSIGGIGNSTAVQNGTRIGTYGNGGSGGDVSGNSGIVVINGVQYGTGPEPRAIRLAASYGTYSAGTAGGPTTPQWTFPSATSSGGGYTQLTTAGTRYPTTSAAVLDYSNTSSGSSYAIAANVISLSYQGISISYGSLLTASTPNISLALSGTYSGTTITVNATNASGVVGNWSLGTITPAIGTYSTPTNTILTVPGGATGSTITVTAIGGGGGGSVYGGARSGGAGGVATYTFTNVTIGSTITYFVGKGGDSLYFDADGGYTSYVTICGTTIYAGGGGGGGAYGGGSGIGQGGGSGGLNGNGGNGSISLSARVGTPIAGYGYGGDYNSGTSGGNGIIVITMETAITQSPANPTAAPTFTISGAAAGTTYTVPVNFSYNNGQFTSASSASVSIPTPIGTAPITGATFLYASTNSIEPNGFNVTYSPTGFTVSAATPASIGCTTPGIAIDQVYNDFSPRILVTTDGTNNANVQKGLLKANVIYQANATESRNGVLGALSTRNVVMPGFVTGKWGSTSTASDNALATSNTIWISWTPISVDSSIASRFTYTLYSNTSIPTRPSTTAPTGAVSGYTGLAVGTSNIQFTITASGSQTYFIGTTYTDPSGYSYYSAASPQIKFTYQGRIIVINQDYTFNVTNANAFLNAYVIGGGGAGGRTATNNSAAMGGAAGGSASVLGWRKLQKGDVITVAPPATGGRSSALSGEGGVGGSGGAVEPGGSGTQSANGSAGGGGGGLSKLAVKNGPDKFLIIGSGGGGGKGGAFFTKGGNGAFYASYPGGTGGGRGGSGTEQTNNVSKGGIGYVIFADGQESGTYSSNTGGDGSFAPSDTVGGNGGGQGIGSGGAGGGSSTTTQGFNGAEGVAYVELWYVVPNV